MSDVIQFKRGNTQNGTPKEVHGMSIEGAFTSATLKFDNEFDGNSANVVITFRADQDMEVNGTDANEVSIRITGAVECAEFFRAMAAFESFYLGR